MSDVVPVNFAKAILRFGYDLACQHMAQVDEINRGATATQPAATNKPKFTIVPKE
jgi:hypothetical protein